jgi:small ligand-binding sensory domain FIST
MRLNFTATPEGGAFTGWPNDLPAAWPSGAALLLLAEPFSFPADVLLSQLNETQKGVPVIGGMASGGFAPGENRLLLGSDEIETGAVAVLVHGGVSITSVVSQGCRPIGQPFVVTKAERNVIKELGGKPALLQLQELFDKLSEEDQRLARHGLHVGQVTDEYRDSFGRGDFLVRNVQGADPESGAIAIGDWVRVGQTVQFHVRDAQTADEDLVELLSRAQHPNTLPFAGALLFTCNGRGTRLFDTPHHDAAAIAHHWPNIPTAGFFAQGEIGPIAGKNFVHGFTASAALFARSAS